MLYYSSQYGTKSTPIQILSILINIVLAHSWTISDDDGDDVDFVVDVVDWMEE